MGDILLDRRGFMKSAVGGFVFLASNEKKQEEKPLRKDSKERKIIYRTLGKTGIKLPVVSMGVMYSDNPNLVRAALDGGIVHMDTAPNYQGGNSERMIGEVIKGRPRDSFVISTKVRLPRKFSGVFTEKATEEAFFESLHSSLKNLGLEYVDILYAHEVIRSESVLFEPLLKGMEKAKKAGKIRFAGVATHGNEPKVIEAATESKLYDVALTSYNFRQKHYLQVKGAISKAAQAGLGIVAMKVMGGTLGDNRAKTEDTGAALKWALQDPNVHTAIPGFTAFDQMETDLAVMENLTLNDSEKKRLQIQASIPGLYCQGCGQCLKQCNAKLPIPDLMRAYMYAYGYRQPALAQELVVSLGLPRPICEDCSVCPIKCLNRWNIGGKVREIVRLSGLPLEFLAG
jgi:aryl-alcohol dehydrogenase-like predicted oxidoreductase